MPLLIAGFPSTPTYLSGEPSSVCACEVEGSVFAPGLDSRALVTQAIVAQAFVVLILLLC